MSAALLAYLVDCGYWLQFMWLSVLVGTLDYDHEIAGLIPVIPLLHSDSGQVVHTHVGRHFRNLNFCCQVGVPHFSALCPSNV